jgi:hypothetical protein
LFGGHECNTSMSRKLPLRPLVPAQASLAPEILN